MAEILRGSVGPAGKANNFPDDVSKVVRLINQAKFGKNPAPPISEVAALMREFEAFLGVVGDGVWKQNSLPWKVLNDLTTPLKLRPITLWAIAKGGYVIAYEGPMLPQLSGPQFALAEGVTYTRPAIRPGAFALELGDLHGRGFPVSGLPVLNLMNADNLPLLLKLVQDNNSWGLPLSLRLSVVCGSGEVSRSNVQALQCPVRPHNGVLLPLDEDPAHNGDPLTYQGNRKTGVFEGKMLWPPLKGRTDYFFCYGPGSMQFVTDNRKRGFDCTTYAGSVCGKNFNQQSSAAQVASHAQQCTIKQSVIDAYVASLAPAAPVRGAAPAAGAGGPAAPAVPAPDPDVALNDVPINAVRAYFNQRPNGYFLVWSTGHIVVVANNTVYQFSDAPRDGYQDPVGVMQWLRNRAVNLTVRKLPARPPRAVT